MNECEETEEGVHPSETPLCGQHDNQTKAQSPEQLHKPDSPVFSRLIVCHGPMSRTASAPTPPNFSESLFSHLLKKVATADGDSVLSLDSGLGSLESLSSDLKKDSFQSSDSRISLERKVSSKYSCVSRKEKTLSYQHSIDFKKNPDDKCSFRSASAPPRLDSSESLFSHLLKDVATDDDDSVQSSHSGISLERKVSSGSIDMSRKRRKTETESYAHSSTFKKKISLERKVSSGSSCESGKKEKEKTTPPTTQELDVGSSAGIET